MRREERAEVSEGCDGRLLGIITLISQTIYNPIDVAS